MTPKPKRQGQLDGLCGIYAIVNALEVQGISKAEPAFRACCSALAPYRWPSTLWEGTTLRDLEVMLKACRDEFQMDHIAVSYPFRSNQPGSNADFWKAFDELFAEKQNSTCAIIGLEEPSLHWLVVRRRGGNLLFIDSDGLRPKRTVLRSDIYAGSRRTGGETYRVNRKEVVLFERIS